MDKGWIKLYRKISENKLWICEPFTRGQAWVDLLLLANHEYGFFYCREHKVEVKRGFVGWSELKLAERWKWSRTKVRKFLKDLEKEQQIIQHKSQSYSTIEIINYEIYQEKEQQEIQQENNRKTTGKQQQDTNKNDKNKKNDKNIDIVQNFYDSEIEKSQNNENYVNFVNILFGKNSLSKKLDRVLSMPIQVSFEQFKTIDQYKHNHKVTISDYLVSMENYKDLLKKNTTVQGTLLNWIRRDLKRQQ